MRWMREAVMLLRGGANYRELSRIILRITPQILSLIISHYRELS